MEENRKQPEMTSDGPKVTTDTGAQGLGLSCDEFLQCSLSYARSHALRS
jgi:hypothetical protein